MGNSVIGRRDELVALVDAAEDRVHKLEDQQREAFAALRQAEFNLEQAVRAGASTAKAEKALDESRARAQEPWNERIRGAQQGAVDARAALQRHTAANLDALVDVLAAQGERAAVEVDKAAERFVEAVNRREAIAAQITGLISEAGLRVRPGSVSASRAEAAARAAAELVTAGGEQPPRIVRDPRLPREGVLPAALGA
jgi:hypothetical protein